jgi:hypothetical protein
MEFRRCTRAVGLPAPGSRVEDATPFAGIAIGCYRAATRMTLEAALAHGTSRWELLEVPPARAAARPHGLCIPPALGLPQAPVYTA